LFFLLLQALSVTETLIKPLEKFRKEQLGAVKEEKKKFDKETEKNYSLIDKHLTLSAKKKDSHLQEADLQVEQTRQHFYELSLEYVCKLQEIQERKKFEFVELMLSFFQGMFTFYHQGHELSKDFNHYKMELQINIQNTRNRFEGTRSEVEELMNKIRQNPKDHKRASQFTAEGYLYVQEKRPAPFASSWVKHYCMYRKTAKKFNMIPFEHRSGGKLLAAHPKEMNNRAKPGSKTLGTGCARKATCLASEQSQEAAHSERRSLSVKLFPLAVSITGHTV
ncbi:rho GTPase-activating protein 10-like, partial [Peromyscus eremicus]|uniref:rho GTPase-activating protein 10-like n=1 Tax=Peromyscus eremicus TaxID=42410 RepID=UPI0027DC7020